MGSHEFSHSRGKVTSIVERISEHRGNNDACSESPATQMTKLKGKARWRAWQVAS